MAVGIGAAADVLDAGVRDRTSGLMLAGACWVRIVFRPLALSKCRRDTLKRFGDGLLGGMEEIPHGEEVWRAWTEQMSKRKPC